MKRAVLVTVGLAVLAGGSSFAQSQALIDAAKREGQLTIIATPRDWGNYGEMIDTFAAIYGLKVNETNPDGTSG